ncbi:MAG: hypothetical protein KF799_09005 [Bdellovibrionales bacterium]|nr:hypothetical protein [Bdellovibrionales bacterium]
MPFFIRSTVLCLAALFSLSVLAAGANLTPEQQRTRNELEMTALRYFIDHAHPDTGLVRDKANSFGPTPDNAYTEASTAATGMGLAIITHASLRGLVTREYALNYFNKLMIFSRDHLERKHGWFMHWVDWKTGKEVWFDGYSTLDTSFFIAGALYAASIFPDSEGAKIAQQFYRDLDFEWMMTDGGQFPDRRTLNLSYRDGIGFNKYQLSIYAEQMLLILLGLGHPTHPLPLETWHAWERREYEGHSLRGVALDMPLFIHQYSMMFVDFRSVDDGHPNVFETSRTASAYNRSVALNDPSFASTRAGFWGFSAGQAPGPMPLLQNTGMKDANEDRPEIYDVWNPYNRHAGVVCIGCMPGSAMFMPQVVLDDTAAWRSGPHGQVIWGLYGLTDSVDLDENWISTKTLGITVGTTYLSLANTHAENTIWSVFNKIPAIERALERISK